MKSNFLAKRNNTGFTLIELVIYIGILILALVIVVSSVAAFGRSYNRIKAQEELSRSGSIAIERMVRDIRSAESVNTSASTLGAHPGQLTLVVPASGGSSDTIQFLITGGTLTVSKNSVSEGSLTQAGISVDSLIFRRIPTAQSEGIKIDMTLSKIISGKAISASFHTTAVLRESYAL